MNNKATPSTKHMDPTTMYAMPRNGFLPPSRDVVDKIIFLEPSKDVTGYSNRKNAKEILNKYALQ